ncbi:MAG: hypothetical protein H0U53_03640, partial [Actinobacteria bacterium]|nr:hypothetical protein [Actinomycetota bacterium]
AVLLGILWPAALYAASAVSPDATLVVAAGGAVLWVALMLVAFAGRDLKLPFIGPVLQRMAAEPPD